MVVFVVAEVVWTRSVHVGSKILELEEAYIFEVPGW